jgi:hypothetical protein
MCEPSSRTRDGLARIGHGRSSDTLIVTFGGCAITQSVPWRRRTPVAAAIMCLLFGFLPVPTAQATGDTWSGTWHRAEVGVDGDLILQESGTTVTGHYTWNAPGGTVAGQTSGVTFNGTFVEAHYRGSFQLELSGKTFTGSYTGENTDTQADISGPFDGTCISGPCLQNGFDLVDPSALTVMEAIFGVDYQKIVDASNTGTNPEKALDAGNALAAAFSEKFPPTGGPESLTRSAPKVLTSAGRWAALIGPDGRPVFPALTACLPIVVRMMANALTATDPAEATSIVKATNKLIALAMNDSLQ